jgi:hypothetical protein
MTALVAAIEHAVAYLAAMERRDMDAAAALIDEMRLELVFPGDRRFTHLDEVVANSGSRYRHVGKTIQTRDAWDTDDGVRVLITGTLSGEWPDGTAFAGIRFADLFDLRDGRIIRQQVWNDTAERRRSGETA